MTTKKYNWELIVERNSNTTGDLARHTQITKDCLYSWSTRRSHPTLKMAILFKEGFNKYFGLDLTVEEMWEEL